MIVALCYGAIRLVAHIWLEANLMLPGQSDTQIVPADLDIYVNASTRLENHQPLYTPNPTQEEVYQYPPFFALWFLPFVWLLNKTPEIFMALQVLIRVVAYIFLIFWWERIFRRMKMKRAAEMWAWTVPLWIVFSSFWSDLGYMNIYLLTVFIATLSIEAVLNENLTWSVIWLTILLQMKPQWAFALAIPLLLGRWRYFAKLLGFTVIVNAVLIGVFMAITGPAYGWHQYAVYLPYIANMGKTIPWRGPSDLYLGYNHSILQIVYFFFGISTTTYWVATAIKVLLVIPLAVICIKQLIHPVKKAGREVPQLALGLTFALYLAVFIAAADWVWEVSMACAILAYLLAAVNKETISKVLIWVVFIPYAAIDLWQIGSYAIYGDKVITAGDYILTDYSIYVPIVMLVILVFYGLLVKSLWTSTGKELVE